MMKQCLILLIAVATLASCKTKQKYVLIETDFGNMKLELYDTTPKHKENFLKLVEEGFYNDLLFHRVMNGFMIQGGDPNSRNSPANAPLGSGGPGYTIEKEFGAYHFKGALAAARQPDQVNPEKASSGSQFYIVHGRPWAEAQLAQMAAQKGITYTAEEIERYKTEGGYAPLDNEYTVFGQVIEGMEVIDKIAAVSVNPANRPNEDVKMQLRIVK